MRNKEKGITLIALVITIIVLLILAGVTLNLSIGENGIFNTAKKAAMEQKKQTYFEEIKLEILEEQTERVLEPTTELFIVSIEKRIKTKAWEKNVLMCDESGIEKAPEASTMLIAETIEGYEIIIDIDNIKETGIIRENYFEKVGKKITVRYDGNGGTGEVASQEIRKGSSIILPTNGFTKTGYEFVGWNTDKDNKDNKAMQPGSEYKSIEENTTLYAIWSVDTVTIQFEANGGQGTITDLTVQKGSTVEALPENTYTKEGYKFKCWKDQEGTEYLDKAKIENIEKDITLTAQWEQITMTASIQTSSLKLTEGTTIQVNGTSTVGIDKVEVLLGEKVIYKELPKAGEEVIQSPYNKTIQISEMNLTNLEFYNTYTPKVKITANLTENKENTTSNITNYTIGNAYSLKKLAEVVNGTETIQGNDLSGETILQVADINLKTVCNEDLGSWIPIGYSSVYPYKGTPFRGVYNGNYYEIDYLYVNLEDTGYCAALFGGVDNGIIKNTILGSNSTVTNNTGAGGIVGTINTTSIINCANHAKVNGGRGVAGIVVVVERTGISKIISCYNDGDITSAGSLAAGILASSNRGSGLQNKCSVEYCYNLGKITGRGEFNGGIVGHLGLYGEVMNCWNGGTVEDYENSSKIDENGGIVGRMQGFTTCSYCYNTASVIKSGTRR